VSVARFLPFHRAVRFGGSMGRIEIKLFLKLLFLLMKSGAYPHVVGILAFDDEFGNYVVYLFDARALRQIKRRADGSGVHCRAARSNRA
jgi:hypothetical protein